MRKIEPIVWKDGRTSYRVRFRMSGKQTSETFGQEKLATRFAKELDVLGAAEAVRRLYDGDRRSTAPTLDQVAAAHIAHLTGITDGTRTTYTRLWARAWSPLVGHTPADLVSRDDLALAVNELGRRYSRKSLENQRGLLAGVLDRCVDQGLLPKNPVKGLRLPRGLEGEAVEMRIITPAEWPDVESRVPAHYRTFVRFLYGVGCRYGEAIALQAQDWSRRRTAATAPCGSAAP